MTAHDPSPHTSHEMSRRSALKFGLAAVPTAFTMAGWAASPAAAADTFVLGTTKPTASNTGVPAGTTLTDLTGTKGVFTASTPGQVIAGKRFRCYVDVRAANVTFRNCEFRGPATGEYVRPALVDCRAASAVKTLIDRCTFGTTLKNMYWCNGVTVRSGASVTVLRCNISAVADALNVEDASLTAHGNYIHDLYFFNNSADHASDTVHPYWAHIDGVQIGGGSGPFIIRGNNFQSYVQLGTDDGMHHLPDIDPATGSWNRRYGAGITVSNDPGVVTGCTITENWFEGGGASFQSNSAAEVGSHLGSIRYNRFGMDQYNYGNNSRYQIRFKRGIVIDTLTTNYFDPDAPSVPAAKKGQKFAEGFDTGIRIDN